MCWWVCDRSQYSLCLSDFLFVTHITICHKIWPFDQHCLLMSQVCILIFVLISTYTKSQCGNVTLDRIIMNPFISLFTSHCGLRNVLWQLLNVIQSWTVYPSPDFVGCGKNSNFSLCIFVLNNFLSIVTQLQLFLPCLLPDFLFCLICLHA